MAAANFDPRFDPMDSEAEANVFGAWFARLGALALLAGAGFGFRYGVDEGFIGPAMRVLMGVHAGFALIVWGDWSHRRDWPRLAQAVSGGGIALLYLSVWSAFQLYGLIGGTEAFVALTAVAAGGGFLALRHDSRVLAALSTIGGFGNGVLVGEGFERPGALFAYVLILDCAVLGLAYVRGWRILDHIAFAATWFVFGAAALLSTLPAELSSEPAETGVLLTFATVYFLLFACLAVARRVGARDGSPASDVFLIAANGIVYVFTTMVLLSDGTIPWATAQGLRGPAILVAAGVHLVAGLVVRSRRADDPVAGVALGSAAVLAAVWVPVQLRDVAVPAAWAVMAAGMIHVAGRTSLRAARHPAYVLLGLSLVYLAGLLTEPGFYAPERVLLSPVSAAFAVHVASLYASAAGIREPGDGEALLRGAIALTASGMTLLWLSLEAIAHFSPLDAVGAMQSLRFTLAGIWGTYAAILLGVGLAARSTSARFLALTVFGITATKLMVHDVWMLDTLYRTFVFMGLGAIFLACSVMYHRFRDLILRDRRTSSAA